MAHVNLQTAELARSRQRVVAASDAARQRLERDIHDGAQQELVAALIQMRALARAGDAVDPQRVAALRTLVKRARATIEELCRGGRPAILAEGGLAVALDAVAETARRGGLTVEVDCRLGERLPADAEAAIYFCCLEALQNSAKHARARQVGVHVERAADEVVVTVSDDGAGFDAARVVPGSGLRNLAERMAAIGGTVSIDSAPGAGTTTRCRLPVPNPAAMTESTS